MRRDKSLEILDRLESEEDRVIRVLLDMVGQFERGWAAVQGEGIRKKGWLGRVWLELTWVILKPRKQ